MWVHLPVFVIRASIEIDHSTLVAVAVFKTAITLEMTRRSNDKRILALHVEMKDMMSVLAMYAQFSFAQAFI